MFLLNETRSDKANRLMTILMRIQKMSNHVSPFLGEMDFSKSTARGATEVRGRDSIFLILRGIFQVKKLYGSLGVLLRSFLDSESGDPNE